MSVRPGPAAIANQILQSLPLDAAPIKLIDLMTQILVENEWQSSSFSARESAERWYETTLARLRQEVGRLNQLGRPVPVMFNSSSDYMIQGACFIEPWDSDDLQENKRRRLRYKEYYPALCRLSPDQFEKLCGRLIGLLGAESPQVTRHSADEGIDFYGMLRIDGMFQRALLPTVLRQLKVWLVGQAKHYIGTQAGTPEIRDLVGAITLARASATGSQVSPLPGLTIKVVDPVFYMFITTGRLSSNAWHLTQESGVIGMDGDMVAALLADAEVGMYEEEFNQECFIAWLDE